MDKDKLLDNIKFNLGLINQISIYAFSYYVISSISDYLFFGGKQICGFITNPISLAISSIFFGVVFVFFAPFSVKIIKRYRRWFQ